jgi:hypothetical protein
VEKRDAGGISSRRVLAELFVSYLGLALLIWTWRADHAWVARHFMPDFRVPWVELEATILGARVAAAGLGFFLLLVARPWIGRFVQARSLRALALDATPTLLAALLAVGAAELVMRVAVARISGDAAARHEPRRVPDAELTFDFPPSRTGYGVLGGRRIQYVFDAAGFRVRAPGAQVDPARPAIVFAGESIMAGRGLSWAESIPGQVEAETGIQSANLAVEGFAVDQAYMRLRRLWGRFRQPVAVVTLLLPSAVYRVIDTDRARLTPGLVWRPAQPEWMLLHVLRRRASYHSTAEIEAGIVTARQALQATAAMARQGGAIPLVVVPVLTPEPEAERVLRGRILDGSGIAYVLAPVDRSWRIPGDRHPDARGARAIARAVTTYLAAHDARVAAGVRSVAR